MMTKNKKTHRLLPWLMLIAATAYFLPHRSLALTFFGAGVVGLLFEELAHKLAERSLEREEAARAG